MNADSKAQKLSPDRGVDAVKTALIEAACEMLAEVGPNAMSVRNVATRAAVNHGQVHHYFGGKQGLIEAAAAHLAQLHYDNAHQRSAGAPVPPPLTLGEDAQYLRAIVRLVLDGDLNTATQEIAAGISVPVEARDYLTRNYPKGKVPTEVKARFALAVASELGWAALEPFILQVADVKERERQDVREQARVLLQNFMTDEKN
jgi:AcrR family transcriptional regulator